MQTSVKSRGKRVFSRPRPFRFEKNRSRFAKKRNFCGVKIDPSRFVNKAIVEDKAENPTVEREFGEFGISKQLAHQIENCGFKTPTPIQAKAIPHIISGADLVGIADTGTGKTGAFLIPLINKILLDKETKILIVAPTRELATQINQELRGLSKGLHISSACCIGGANISRQIYELRRANQFIVGTPGRLKDLVNRRRVNLANFNTIVLDEADRMLDMGFIQDMRFLVAGMPKAKQTLFFSATINPKIQKIVGEFLSNPVNVSIKTRDTSKNVDQDVVKLSDGKTKIQTLQSLLGQDEFAKVLIFGKTKRGVEHLCQTLVKKGFKAESIHGNKTYPKRQKALDMFKRSAVNILVATDVAARGLDISDISHVINYDLPETYEDYIHRIGRTGRGNKFGKALTFVD